MSGEIITKQAPSPVATGDKFTRWTVIGPAPKRGKMNYHLCRCDCGKVKEVRCSTLRAGLSMSCGCLLVKHGFYKLPEFQIWRGIVHRCTNPRYHSFPNYGGRGITISDEWMDFARFYADMGARPSESHSVERKDNSKGYSSDNCVWATPVEQSRNTRRSVMIEFQGERLCMAEWAERRGWSYWMLRARFRAGWDVERALTTPHR